eukprot:TRINITY_DN3508_c0_g1_i1.p1 TRINITY_DN3508_c0_g1~~TRINITY_DN3508_c0_g1_i1.p1  ORF type:complete len:385 (+),score=64.04 TRINITY_DN3508_c0_g1_i1:41-1195(+)
MPANVVVIFGLLFARLLGSALGDCPTAPSSPEDRRPNLRSLTLATFNVEWLFEAGKSSSSPWKTDEEVELHLASVAKMIDRVDADVWVFEEVQADCIILERLRNKCRFAAQYKYYLIKGTDTATGQNVALFTKVDPDVTLWRSALRSKYPLAGSACGYDGSASDTAVSKHLLTTVSPRNFGRIGIIGAHLIAFPTTAVRCSQREAQATVLAQLAQDLETQFSLDGLVIMGDLNDYSSINGDCCGNVPTSRVVSQILPGALSPRLYEVSAMVSPSSERYTHPEPYKSQIDHLHLSSWLADAATTAWIDHSTDNKADPYFSDHWPFAVTLNANLLGPKKSALQKLLARTLYKLNAPVAVAGGLLVAALLTALAICWRRCRQTKVTI